MVNFQAFHNQPDWLNREQTGIRRVAAHTKWSACDTLENARQGKESRHIHSLNGEWRFKLYGKPEMADDFYEPSYTDTDFSNILVPGNWEIQGYGEPIYTNQVMPWSPALDESCNIPAKEGQYPLPNPPYVPGDNPVGCYRRIFFVPERIGEKRVFIRFEGVESAFYIWVNGHPVGFSMDSKLPCEFDITDYLTIGQNLLAVMVLRFSLGTYLEDQDYWYLSGIFRDVYLIVKPCYAIFDYFIQAEPLLPFQSGLFTADVFLTREKGYADGTVCAWIYDETGQELASMQAEIVDRAEYRIDKNPTAGAARLSCQIPCVRTWSHEQPVLYRAVFVLLGKNGTQMDIETCRFGFRKIQIKNGVLLLNGKRIVLQGVNRHEHTLETGRSVSVEHMRREILEMKRMNINSVRTSHYPNAPSWYELCDELGILLICECNLETHAVRGQLTHDPSYASHHVDRAARMVQCFRNHSSIYAWSLGNESGIGANHAAMYGLVKELDGTRLCQYEAGLPGKNISDIRGWMYADQNNIMQMLTDTCDDRPVILVEYAYQIRNSGGGLYKFRDLAECYAHFQGGYIWDWQDKCLLQTAENGLSYPGYGGDFNEKMTEYECPLFMCCNGIVLPDLTWKPVAYEVKQVYAPIRLESGNAPGHFVLINNSFDMDSLHFCLTARLLEDGKSIAEREVELPHTPPLSRQELSFSFTENQKADCEYFCEFIFTLRKATMYAPAGYQVSVCRFLEKNASRIKNQAVQAKIRLISAGDCQIVQGQRFEYIFRGEGFDQALFDGQAYLTGGNVCLDRPPTGLDAVPGWGLYDKFFQLRRDQIYSRGTKLNIFMNTENTHAVVHADTDLQLKNGESILCKTVYRIDGEGRIDVCFQINVSACSLPLQRAGLEFCVPPGFEALEWYGLGGIETYPDRKLAARIGVFSGTVTDQHFPFIPPSECGGHEETRLLTLRNTQGRILRIQGESPFHFDARHYSVKDCEKARHEHELKKTDHTVLHIDAAHAPIGGDMGWSTVMPKDQMLCAGVYSLAFSIDLQ